MTLSQKSVHRCTWRGKNGGKYCTFCPNPYNPCRSKSHLLWHFLLEDKENSSAQELNIANASEQSRGTEREVRRTRVSHGPVQIPPSALYPPPHTYVPLCPPPQALSWNRAKYPLAKMEGWSGDMPDPLPPRLHCSKTTTCLIMINCCLDNQIQTQKVGDDSPRTLWERQGMCSLGKKRIPLPHTLTLLILSISNRINSKIIWEDSRGRTEARVCVFPAQTHIFSVFSSFLGSHLLQWLGPPSEWLTAMASLHCLSLLFGWQWHKEREGEFHGITINFCFSIKRHTVSKPYIHFEESFLFAI